jgi:hypothetical protein
MRTIEGLSPEQINAPLAGGWTVKDHLAHLATWEQFMLRYHLGGQTPHEVIGLDAGTFENLDEDGLNGLIYERNTNRSVEEVLTDSRRSHEVVLSTLAQMSFADLLLPRYPNDPGRDPIINWVIGNTYHHYQEHQQTIIKEL